MDETTGSIETYLASQRRLQDIAQRHSGAIVASVVAAPPAWAKAVAGFVAAVRTAVAQIAAAIDRWQPWLERWAREDARRTAVARWCALSPRRRKDVLRRHRKGKGRDR